MSTQLVGICGNCILGKMDERLFKTQSEHDSQVFRTLSADLIGLMTPEAQWSHAKFSLIIHNNFTSFGCTFNLTHKDHTTRTVIDLEKVIENKFQKQIHTLRADSGDKFINNKLQNYCGDRGIISTTSVTHNPELNGRAER